MLQNRHGADEVSAGVEHIEHGTGSGVALDAGADLVPAGQSAGAADAGEGHAPIGPEARAPPGIDGVEPFGEGAREDSQRRSWGVRRVGNTIAYAILQIDKSRG